MEAITIYRPRNLTEDVLPKNDRGYFDEVAYLAHLINCRRFMKWRDTTPYRDAGFVPLHSRFLQDVLGTRHASTVVTIARNNGVVERTPGYSVNRYPRGYRLTKPYDDAPHHQFQLSKPSLAKRIRKEKERRLAEFLGKRPVNKDLYEDLMQLRIVIPDHVYASLKDKHQKTVDIFRDEKWIPKQDEFGRIHTCLTSLPRDLRQYLRYGDQELVNVDISNSQPLFLGMLVKEEYEEPSKSNLLLTYLL